jgi:small nuclear ribonucleoprotein (snRNP)-like protein
LNKTLDNYQYPALPIFFSMFKTLEGKTVLLELKNSLQLKGKLVSVDQYLNLKLDNVEVVDRDSFPQLVRGMAAAQPPRSPPRPLSSRKAH